jgi:ubiquinone/menaquinone biosynthesis C-methylase UbiE
MFAEMIHSQERYPNDLDQLEAWIRDAATPGQRLLEIGCGDGALVRRLAGGFDVLGVDPEAEPSDVVRRIRLEELDEQPYDVIFASLSLHHLDDPVAATLALRRLSQPGTILLVREFDRVVMDHPATLRWWFDYSKSRPRHPEDEHIVLPETFEEFVPMWREMMEHHVTPWDTVREMLLGTGFTTTDEQATAHLFRWGLGEDLRDEEERLAAAGTINLAGRRWSGRRLS